MTRPVALLGALDRFNYGDLLFPVVIEAAFARLGAEVTTASYGLHRSDLSRFGARPTHSYNRLFRDIEERAVDAVIVAGGEVVGARWSSMLMYTSNPAASRAIKVFKKLAGEAAAERLGRAAMRARNRWPWVLSPAELPRPVAVAYNCVGGSTVLNRMRDDELAELVAALEQSVFVAVRDEATAARLGAGGLDGLRLSPDTAVLVSALYPLDALAGRVRPEVRDIVERFPDGFLTLQLNRPVGAKQSAALPPQLEEIYRCHGLATVLLPIGRAPGHEDQHPLRRVGRALSTPHTFPPLDLSIFEIMYLIARARVFTGTSLHGAITALSFDVPHFALTREIPKLLNHLANWDLEEHSFGAEPARLRTAVDRVLAVPAARREARRAELAARSWTHFRALAAALDV